MLRLLVMMASKAEREGLEMRIDRLLLLTENQEAIDLLEAATEALNSGDALNARQLITRAEEEMDR